MANIASYNLNTIQTAITHPPRLQVLIRANTVPSINIHNVRSKGKLQAQFVSGPVSAHTPCPTNGHFMLFTENQHFFFVSFRVNQIISNQIMSCHAWLHPFYFFAEALIAHDRPSRTET
jgi:hypothetical protein